MLRALLPRVNSVNAESLRVVFVLERFLDVQPDLVLDLTEAILHRALDVEGNGAYAVISECLALSVSLRIALPSERQRVHLVFERALAAGASAASEALDTLDGRVIGRMDVSWYHPIRLRR